MPTKTTDERNKRTSRVEWNKRFELKVHQASEVVVAAIEEALDSWDALAPLTLSAYQLHSFRPAVIAVVAEYKALGWAVEIAQERVIFNPSSEVQIALDRGKIAS